MSGELSCESKQKHFSTSVMKVRCKTTSLPLLTFSSLSPPLRPAPSGLMSSHIQSPVILFTVCFFAHHVNLLTSDLSLFLDLRLCHQDVSPSESCYRPVFYSQTPPYSIPPALILLYPSHASPHLAHLHSWEWTEKAEKIEKQACDSSTSGRDPGWPGTFYLFFFSFTPFLPSLHLHLSLLCPGTPPPHSPFFPLNSSSPALSVFFSVVPLQRGTHRHQAPFSVRAPVWLLGGLKEETVAGQREKCARKLPLVRQTSVADTLRCVSLPNAHRLVYKDLAQILLVLRVFCSSAQQSSAIHHPILQSHMLLFPLVIKLPGTTGTT